MSFTGANYDTGAYRTAVRESMAPGHYILHTPLFKQPCDGGRLTDGETELFGISRRNSHCPGLQFQPGQGADLACKLPGRTASDKERLQSEDTRFSNPACSLRGTGVNRWMTLCDDPQAHALSPVPPSSSDRYLAKDNHRPLIPQPMRADAVLPPPAPEHVEQKPYEFVPVPMLPELLGRRPFKEPPHF